MGKSSEGKKKTKREYAVIGIDGGGTKTRGALYVSGKKVAETIAGTSRVGAVGVGESCERLLNVIKLLCEQADMDSLDIDATVIGLAGVWLEEEKKRSAHLLKTLSKTEGVILNDLIVTSDAELAAQGAFDGKPGIVLIVGTGSIAIGKTSKGKIERCGGWGIELDDEGSGAWIGREGITAVFRALDGRGKKTELTEKLAEMIPTIDVKEPRTIVKAYAERNFEYQLLTPPVMKAAENDDEVCKDIVQRASNHLIELVEALGRNYKTKEVKVVMMGGVIENKTLLANLMREKFKKHKKFKLISPKKNAIDGAIDMGVQLLEEME